jgi:hypothetical protein
MQNQKRYWLRGGIASCLIAAAVVCFSMILDFYLLSDIIITPGFLVDGYHGGFGGGNPNWVRFWTAVIATWFFFGTVLGGIYGKIRNRKMSSPSTNY